MPISKLITFSLTALLLGVFLQLSNAQNTSSSPSDTFDTIVNIVDPAEIEGTEVLLKDLI